MPLCLPLFCHNRASVFLPPSFPSVPEIVPLSTITAAQSPVLVVFSQYDLGPLFLVFSTSVVRPEPVHKMDKKWSQAFCKVTLWYLKIQLFLWIKNKASYSLWMTLEEQFSCNSNFFSGYVSQVKLLTYVPRTAPSYAIISSPFLRSAQNLGFVDRYLLAHFKLSVVKCSHTKEWEIY